jgi:hypothetical protein
MNTTEIVLAINAEIAQLRKVKEPLTGDHVAIKRKRGRPVSVSSSKSVKATSSASKKSVGRGVGR